jgi:hypothetical protein
MTMTPLEEKCVSFLLYVQDVLQDGVEEIVEEVKERRKHRPRLDWGAGIDDAGAEDYLHQKFQDEKK